MLKANYIPLAFSDHHGHIVEIQLPDSLSRSVCPKSNSFFRIKSEVVLDLKFQSHLKEAMAVWTEIRSFGLDVLTWLENIVKPGIKKLALKHGKELNRIKKEQLNLLRLRQSFLNRKLFLGETWRLRE